MKKRIAIMVLLVLAIGTILALPMMGSAANCRNALPQPTPQGGSTTQSLAPVDNAGVAWVHTSGSQAGAKGGHGYIVVSNTASGVTVYGHNSDSGVNGDVSVSQNGPQRICIDHTGS